MIEEGTRRHTFKWIDLVIGIGIGIGIGIEFEREILIDSEIGTAEMEGIGIEEMVEIMGADLLTEVVVIVVALIIGR